MRYLKNHNSISIIEQEILKTKKATIIGCGGLGQYIASQLSRLGLGAISIVDHDVFDETNLNRQLYCHTQNIGKVKVLETLEALQKINPEIVISAVCERFEKENSHRLLCGSDVVIDALDSIKYRLLLQEACKELNIPLISAAIGGWYGQLMVIMPGDDTLNRIYKDAQQTTAEKEFGNPAFTPCLLASLEVSETIKLLLGKRTVPSGKMLYIDLLNLMFEVVEI